MTEMMEVETNAEAPQPVIANYWGVEETHKHYLPDGLQWIEFKTMNEGDKVKFQKMTNQDLVVGRDNTAKIAMNPAGERHELIKASVIDWYMFMPDANGKMNEVRYGDGSNFRNWLMVAPPKLVEDLEFAIRKANPWLQADMSIAEVDKEIDRLIDLKKELVAKEAGESVSANK